MRNSMKRVLAVMLAVVMLLGLTACGEKTGATQGDTPTSSSSETKTPETAGSQETEAPKVTFTLTGYNTQAGLDYEDDFLKYFEEKFNVDMQVMNNENDGASERFGLQASGGTLSNLSMWNGFGLSAYYEYVDQGLFKALPEGWEEKWPNLYFMVEKSGLLDLLTVDGAVYAIPHATFGGKTAAEKITYNNCLYVRADWLKEVGMEAVAEDGCITLAELRAYLEAVGKANLCSKPVIGAAYSDLLKMFLDGYGLPYNDFVKDGEGFVWTPTREGYADMLGTAQKWYQDDLIDLDFYTKDKNDYLTEFATGQIAALFNSRTPVHATKIYTQMTEADASRSADDIMPLLVVKEDGILRSNETTNYWMGSVIAPETDDATTERILDILDYVCTLEGGIVCQAGIPNVDWKFDESGKVVNLGWSNDKYNSRSAIYMLGWCADDYALSGLDTGSVNMDCWEKTMKLYRLIDEAEDMYQYPYEYAMFNGDSKKVYTGAVSLKNYFAQFVTGNEDAETAVKALIEDNRTYWEPLLNDISK